MMPLNIKDERVHEQAKLLAALTGESITSAVRKALAERLSAVRRQQAAPEAARSVERLVALARPCATHSPPERRSSDHAALNGDNGMPG
jgi:antitoxin VapB